jgi:hypothetical protein
MKDEYTVAETKVNGRKKYIVINVGTSEVQSSWSTSLEARKLAKQLNRFFKSKQGRK